VAEYDKSAALKLLDEVPNGEALVERLNAFVIETPSWGYADTGTRFGKFHQPASARTVFEKLDDAAHVHGLTGICPTVAIHVLWDFPNGADPAVLDHAKKVGVRIGSINPNVFQNQAYKFGSFGNQDKTIREQAIRHCLESIALGQAVDSDLLSLWFADGTNYPGQDDIRSRKRRFSESLQQIYAAMPADMTMLVEYKPFEPAFYHTDIADWGMAYAFAKQLGAQAKVLVDTGHHYQGQNVEQIVAWLIDEEMLGGFHLNDRRYADDDLTAGSIDPYQVFRIFHEVASAEEESGKILPIAYMVDQSHNLKPKIEAMLQTVIFTQEIFAKALLVDRAELRDRQAALDLVGAETVLRGAFMTDTRPLTAHLRAEAGLPPDPIAAHRESRYEERAGSERQAKYGTPSDSAYA
jgi:L-rhamnose isomerase/sugar isomerase